MNDDDMLEDCRAVFFKLMRGGGDGDANGDADGGTSSTAQHAR